MNKNLIITLTLDEIEEWLLQKRSSFIVGSLKSCILTVYLYEVYNIRATVGYEFFTYYLKNGEPIRNVLEYHLQKLVLEFDALVTQNSHSNVVTAKEGLSLVTRVRKSLKI